MVKSALQIARAAYQPKVPAALKGAVKAVDGLNEDPNCEAYIVY